ncbi:MFS transporter [Candidatus Methylopumilus planktonicus]|uniref:MFS transporter n=1 Tax=Candidatus Methylopumilus TaxID=1679002 RepID=UPI00111FA47C|nr:MFS transporter [Candidatus Methylopumilus planktonicus]QDD06596.1 MFS transporter [Candidatus Methylopumilus planktonicus]QDD07931.1 MFS transporter [Candidatus Methylopumilus planktonicus]QDD09257.1 MFS transporter [Candidatus Methylopumilus planktonicus]
MSSSHNLHWRLSRFYFFYYFFVGSFVPYWGIYLQSENFSPSSIGILLSLFQISRIVAPNFWGWLADHSGHRVKWIKLTSFLGLIGFIGVFWAKGFFWIFLIMSALSLFTSSTLPLAESLTLAHLATTDGHYSRIRLWGSIGFIVASLFLGYLIDLQGINILLWVLLITQAIIFFLSNTIPEAKEIHHKKNDLPIWKIIKTPSVVALLIGCTLMVSAHGVLYNFYSIYLKEHGYSSATIGWLWAVGVICEIFIFMLMPKILRRYSLKTILLLSLFLGVIRFILIGASPNHFYLLLIAQMFHAATFGSFHAASIEVIAYFFKGRNQSRGQAIYNSVAYGIGGTIGGLGGGYLIQYLGGQLGFMIAAISPLIGFVVIWYGLKLEIKGNKIFG